MKKPICECGGDLEYYETRSVERTYQILKSGRRAERFKQSGHADFIGSGLNCKACRTNYETNMDADGVIIRGEKL